jgi:hypothetical protein
MTRRRRQRREPPVVETCRMCGGHGARLREEALRETVAAWLRRRPLLCDRCASQLAVPRRRERGEEGSSS